MLHFKAFQGVIASLHAFRTASRADLAFGGCLVELAIRHIRSYHPLNEAFLGIQVCHAPVSLDLHSPARPTKGGLTLI